MAAEAVALAVHDTMPAATVDDESAASAAADVCVDDVDPPEVPNVAAPPAPAVSHCWRSTSTALLLCLY